MRISAAFLALTALSLPALAEKGHVHGEGSLEVVIDKGNLSLRLELPPWGTLAFRISAGR